VEDDEEGDAGCQDVNGEFGREERHRYSALQLMIAGHAAGDLSSNSGGYG
jgi:hypothetical protein